MTVSVQEWIREVDSLREHDELLRRGYWHGYTEADGGVAPMKGRYYLVRWARPTIAASHDSREEVLRLARAIEEAVQTAHDPAHE